MYKNHFRTVLTPVDHQNQDSFNFSEDHNNIFDHKYHIDPGNLFSI